MQQGGDAFQSIPEQFKRRLGRNSWEDQRTSPNSSDVPEEQEMSRATYDLALHITGLFVLRRATHSPCELTSVCKLRGAETQQIGSYEQRFIH